MTNSELVVRELKAAQDALSWLEGDGHSRLHEALEAAIKHINYLDARLEMAERRAKDAGLYA